MQLIINLPNRDSMLAFHRERWDAISHDVELSKLEYRIETNALGQIIMTPPARYIHSRRQAKIAQLIESQIGGYSATECGMITGDGVKIADVTWLSAAKFLAMGHQNVLESAAEICVEILSPSNSQNEIQNKFRLYFDAGAQECWICDLSGRMTYYMKSNPNEPKLKSPMCPEFPEVIGD